MKRAIILSGVSGTGKTHARLNDPELKGLPYLDIADVYREYPELDWAAAAEAVMKRARRLLQEHDAIVIEGYYLPGSATREWLVDDLKVAGAKVEIREFWASFQVCALRITQQWERGEIGAQECRKRLELLRKCWRPQEE